MSEFAHGSAETWLIDAKLSKKLYDDCNDHLKLFLDLFISGGDVISFSVLKKVKVGQAFSWNILSLDSFLLAHLDFFKIFSVI